MRTDLCEPPGSNPLAGRSVGLGETFVEDLGVPAPGRVVYYLATGLDGGKSDLAVDGEGVVRPNGSPCP